jgi:aerobic carbon-monoxide dehydrogenase large subunit
MAYTGKSVKRLEDPELLRGAATFVGDIRRPGMLHAVVVRSPHAHARILSIDTAEARQQPSVVTVLTAADVKGVGVIPMRLAPREDLIRALQHPIASDRVRYVGEPVAVVVAGSRYKAEDAAEFVLADYEPLDVVVDPRVAMQAGAPVLHDSVPDNIAGRLLVRSGDVDRAIAEADLVIEEEFAIQRHTGVPLETRGLVAELDRSTGVLTVWGPTKVTHFNRGVLAHLLDMPESRIRMVEPSVGGGFGIRGEFYPEDFLIPFLARQLGRPVCWIEDRSEHLLSANHSREQRHFVQLAVRQDGKILGLKDTVLNNMGGYIRTHGATVPTMTAAYLPGPYRIPSYHCEALSVLTNKTPAGTYRGPGRFEASFVRERLMDIVARRLDLDPAEVRRRNFVQPQDMPYRTGTTEFFDHPVTYDSGDYPGQFERALSRFDYAGSRAWCEEARSQGRSVGIGIGCFVEKSGLGPWEYARVEVDSSGEVVVYSGAAALGQGLETALAQIVADGIGASMDRIRVVHGDTAVVPFGVGTFASRATVLAGNAALVAAQRVRDKMLAIAAQELEVTAADLVVQDGRVSVRGDEEASLSFGEVARLAAPGTALARGFEPGLAETGYFEAEDMVYPYGVHLALVEVDRDTGMVKILRYHVAYDAGRLINPKLVEGQILGGLAQGVGGTLLEELVYDEEGQLISGSFMDYLLPTAVEVPHVDVELTEEAPSPHNPLKIKGAGEGGTVGVSAALTGAVADALGLSSELRELPLTPERIFQLSRLAPAAQPAAGDGDD